MLEIFSMSLVRLSRLFQRTLAIRRSHRRVPRLPHCFSGRLHLFPLKSLCQEFFGNPL
jgi:hypothetical protein